MMLYSILGGVLFQFSGGKIRKKSAQTDKLPHRLAGTKKVYPRGDEQQPNLFRFEPRRCIRILQFNKVPFISQNSEMVKPIQSAPTIAHNNTKYLYSPLNVVHPTKLQIHLWNAMPFPAGLTVTLRFPRPLLLGSNISRAQRVPAKVPGTLQGSSTIGERYQAEVNHSLSRICMYYIKI